MSNTSVQKHCHICDKDVSRVKRVRDTEGNYYCHECWAARQRSGQSEGEVAESPSYRFVDDDSRSDLPIQSPRRTQSSTENVRPVANRVIPQHLAEIAKWERRLLVMIIFSIIPFVGILCIPITLFVVYRLAQSMGKNGLVWAVGCIIPYVSIPVLLILNFSATGMLRMNGLEAPLFGKWRFKRA